MAFRVPQDAAPLKLHRRPRANGVIVFFPRPTRRGPIEAVGMQNSKCPIVILSASHKTRPH